MKLAVAIVAAFLSAGMPADAALRKRVAIDVRSDKPGAARLIAGALSKELCRYGDMLVIDEAYENRFRRADMKYHFHIIVQVDVVQMYTAESVDRSWLRRVDWSRAPALLAASAAYPVMTAALVALPFQSDDKILPARIESHFVANVTLFDMPSGRSFARTQITLTFPASNPRSMAVDDDIILTRVAAKGLRKTSKWVRQQTKARPGLTWVFTMSDDLTLVNAGALDGVKPGQILKVYRPIGAGPAGDGEAAARGVRRVGQIKVTDVDDLFSFATPVGCALAGEYIGK